MRAVTVEVAKEDTTRTWLRFGWATIPMILAYVVVVSATFLRFEPAPITVYDRGASKTDVFAGEQINIIAHITRSRGGCSSVSHRWWATDDEMKNVIRSSMTVYDAAPAGRTSVERAITIPDNAPIGPLWLRTHVEFKCNPVQYALGGTEFIMPDILFVVHHKPEGVIAQ